MNESPYVKVLSPKSEDGFYAFIALKLESIGIEAGRNSGTLEQLKCFLNHQVDFIATLPGMGNSMAIEMRLASHPEPASPRRGAVDVLLRMRVCSATRKQARKQVLDAYHSIFPNLLAISDTYHWLTLDTAQSYNKYFPSPTHAYMAEIMRREENIGLDRVLTLPPRHPIGFNAMPKSTDRVNISEDDGLVYFVFPFVRSFSRLQRLFKVLLAQRRPVEISLALMPTVLTVQENEYLYNQIERCESFLQRDKKFSQESEKLIPALLRKTLGLLDQLQRTSFALMDDCFMTKAMVASHDPISPGLMDALGGVITEPVGSQDSYSDITPERNILSGGYDWVKHEKATSHRTALNDFSLIEFATIQQGLAPPAARRLRYLAPATEANAVFRLPVPGCDAFPGIETRLARTLPPPANTPVEGLFLGDNLYLGFHEPVRLLRSDRRRHMYTVGQTGTGKSSLLLSMIMQDICAGEGVGVMDPHGELVDDILPLIPENRIKDVIYLDPTNQESIIGLNLLDYRDSLDRASAINHLLEIFDEIYNMREVGGPVFELYLRNSALLAMADPDRKATLADIQRIFVDRGYRNHQLRVCTDPLVRSFWKDVATRITDTDFSLPTMTAYITSKISPFIYNDLMRPIVLQQRSSVDFLETMNQRKILLVDLAKGKLGGTNARFLGMILLSLIERAAFARSGTNNLASLPDFYLYVDEFQNMATEGFIDMLSEARKYRLNLILANQYIHQVPEAIRNAIMGNVGTKLSFRVGLQDAEVLQHQYSTLVSKYDLMGLSNYNAYLTTLISGEATLPFSVRTRLYDGKGRSETADAVRTSSSKKYGKPRCDVLKKIDDDWSKDDKEPREISRSKLKSILKTD